MTVHKSQGSQWGLIIMPIFNTTKSDFIDRSMIYTVFMCGSEQVVLVGDFEALKTAVGGQTAANRGETAMDYHIGRCLEERNALG
ncbi:ATP-binding domain-containing protein [Leisingera aquaemixtae]|uniref:ATP-binding domain-containing protein n=1 Tax=Leisingera aquaemixtae TaxID=1396826 RepID=UPI00130EF6DC